MKFERDILPRFRLDLAHQADYYLDHGGAELAERFARTVDQILDFLSTNPRAGRARKFRHPTLVNLHSYSVQSPFEKFLIFYRITGTTLEFVRLLHGARNLPRRLLENEIDQL